MNMGTMASGAKEPGWQAAVDDALSTLASVSAGAEMMSGCGLLDGSKTLSYAQLLMEAEIYGIVQKVAAGIEVSDETLALNVIRKVGPNGTYLAEKHTRAHMAEIWRPGIWDRTPYDAWLARRQGAARSRAPRRRRGRSSRRTCPTRSPTTCAPSSGGSSRPRTPSWRTAR